MLEGFTDLEHMIHKIHCEVESLRLASYNSRGHAIDRIDYINSLMTTNDIGLVQEHLNCVTWNIC